LYEAVVLRVRTDPKPQNAGLSVGQIDPQRPVMKADSDRPKIADFFQVEGWMARIAFQQRELSIRRLLHGFR